MCTLVWVKIHCAVPLAVFSFCAKLGVRDQNGHPEKSDTYWVASQNFPTIAAVGNDT